MAASADRRMRRIGTIAIIWATCVGLRMGERLAAGEASSPVVYEQGFERDDADSLLALGRTPEGLNELSNCGAVLLEQGVCTTDSAGGKRSWRVRLAFRGDGSANPIFYLPKPIPVDGPLYLSFYYKILQQDPESFHRIRLLAWGEYPNDPQPTLGKLSTVKTRPPDPAYADCKPVWQGANLLTNDAQPAKNGWVFRRSGDIHKEMLDAKRILVKDGMCLFAFSVSIWGCRAGRGLTLLIDDIRLSRQKPFLPPSPEELAGSLAVFKRLGADYGVLAKRYGDAAQRKKHTELYARLTQLADRLDRDGNAALKARFVSLVQQMRRSYYTLKLLEMSQAQGRESTK